MSIAIKYACISHAGLCRKINQDNFVCMTTHMPSQNNGSEKMLADIVYTSKNLLFGVFDGMGGEEYGEIAACIAAQKASEISFNRKIEQSFDSYCYSANTDICKYASENNISSMGTTAAMLMFHKKNAYLCNIGDSKIFLLSTSNKKLSQISYDHVALSVRGQKPPLLQNLGIPENELKIKPFHLKLTVKNKDRYLICSDGLTDMVSLDEIEKIILDSKSVGEATENLLNSALENGGKDNITIILCEIKKENICRCLRRRK